MSKELKPDARLIAEEFLNERWRARTERAGQSDKAELPSLPSLPSLESLLSLTGSRLARR